MSDLVQLKFLFAAHPMSGALGALFNAGEDVQEAIKEEVLQHISTDVEITIGDVKMFLAAWLDPEHWNDDWRQTHDMSVDDVEELLSNAVEPWERSEPKRG